MEREREEGLTPVMQFHSCAASSEGGLKCWGHGGYGQVMLHAAAIGFDYNNHHQVMICSSAIRFLRCSKRAGVFR
jgi:hypothetical protein